jgi:hypothetical protein
VLNLIKLSVGSASVDSLARWQAKRFEESGALWHQTRMTPRRGAELLDGGSIYWVIKGLVQARQPLIGLEPGRDREGRGFVKLMLERGLIRVAPRPCRPFQGWRYLPSEDAPADLAGLDGDLAEMPPAMLAELRELGLM